LRPSVRLPLLVVAVAAAGLFIAGGWWRSRDAFSAWTAVEQAIVSTTPFAGCLSSVATAPRRAPSSWSGPSAVLRLLEDVERDGTSEQIRRLAAGYLLIGDAPRAADLLLQRLETDDAAEIWNDLAVAYLERAKAGEDIEPIVRALDAAQRAVLKRPDDAVASFNLAVAADRLRLADVHRAALSKSGRVQCGIIAGATVPPDGPVPDSPQSVTERLEREVLRQWAASEMAGPRGAGDAALERARTLAEALQAGSGERFWIDLVSSLRREPAAAANWADYLLAVESLENERFAAVQAPLGRAARGTAHMPAFDAAVTLERTTLLRLAGRAADADRTLRRLIADSETRSYLRVTGRALWQLGLLVEEQGALGEAYGHYLRAEQLLDRAGDRESRAVVRIRLARFFQQVNERARAWRLMLDALGDLPFARRYRRDAILRSAAVMAAGSRLHAAALAFQQSAFEAALQARSPGGLAFLYPDRARELHAIGMHDAAAEALREGRRWLAELVDPQTADMARAIQLRTSAAVMSADDPTAAVDALTQVLTLYRSRGNEFATPEIQLARAQNLRRLGRLADAEQALDDGIATLERRRDSLLTRLEQVRVTALSWSLVRELADLRASRHERQRALEAIERGRSFGTRRRPIGAVPPRAVIVTYVVLPSGRFGVVQHAGGTREFDIHATLEELEAAARAYRAAILSRDAESSRTHGQILSRALLTPIAAELQAADLLVIVPDPVLTAVPFPALPSPAGDHALVDRLSIVLAPSLAAAVAPRRERAARGTLVIGDPETDPGLRLPRLPGARGEAQQIAALYPGARMYLGKTATKSVLLAHAPQASMIHFAGHALADEADVSLSRLVVSPAADDPAGAVFDRDLSQLDLSATRVVVLGACDTGREGQAAGPAVFGFARTFLDLGAGAVVATLWPIADEASRVLFLRLHRRLREGRRVADALQDTQRELRAEGVAEIDWAGVVVIGHNVAMTR
jgi:CHAT domain-containing protein